MSLEPSLAVWRPHRLHRLLDLDVIEMSMEPPALIAASRMFFGRLSLSVGATPDWYVFDVSGRRFRQAVEQAGWISASRPSWPGLTAVVPPGRTVQWASEGPISA